MKKFISFLLFVCCCSVGWAQAPKAGDVISGTVRDDIEPLMMVNVVEVDKNKRIVAHGVTDINGNFSFKIANPKDNIQVSYIGYQTQVIPITKRTFHIVMKSSTMLKTVEIKAVKKTQSSGLSIPVTEISGATSTIDMKEFEGLSMTSVDEALQGRISGLDIVMNSGDLGAGTTMRLRGVSTINADANPLIVVNGNVWTNDALSDFDFTNANEERFAELLSVNPEDIESITVLKDASATAIWGSQGGNGVIEIKTKRGKRGKTRVDYTFRLTATRQPEAYKLLNGNDYTMYLKEAFFNPTLSSEFSNSASTNYIPEINYDKNFSEYNMYNDNTDWADLVKQTGVYQQHFVSLQGGGEKASFRISAGYDNQKGSIIKQHLDRFTTRVALDYYVSDRITVKTNFDMNYTKNQKNYTGLLALAWNKMPNLSPYLEDENGNDTNHYYTMNRYVTTPVSAARKLLEEQYNMANPLAVAEYAKNDEKTIRLTPEFIINYDILGTESDQTRLTYEGQINFNIDNSDEDSYYPGSLLSSNWAADEYNLASTKSYKSNSLSTRHTLTFIPHFNNEAHSLMVMARMNWNQGNSSSQYTEVKWLPTSDITSPFGGGRYTSPSTSFGEWKGMWYLFSAHYAYKGKYIFDATLRRDAVTKFGPSHRWGNFPGLAFRWNISDEPFMEKFTWLDMLSIRPGWGKTGRQPSADYLYFSKYATGANYIGETSVYPSNIRLSNLKWEWQETYNLGFDLGLFRKWEGHFEFYTSKSTDLLMNNYSIPSSSGYGSLSIRNVGSMRNTGWEFNIDGRDLIHRGKFSMDVNMTFANNRNEILTMDPTVMETLNGDFDYSNGSYLSRVQLHNPLGAIYGFRYKGVYQYSDYSEEEIEGVSGPNAPVARDANGNVILNAAGNPKSMYFDYEGKSYEFVGGDAIYEDINHDGNINELDIVYLGSSLPKLTGGFGFRLKYGRLSANVQFNYRVGQKVINAARMGLENMATSNNQSQAINWRWRTEGDSGSNILPRAVTTKTDFQTYNYLGSDRFVEDASFLRLNYLNLSYSVPEKTLKQWGLSRLSFYLTFNNLFVITKYSGADPEVNQSGYTAATDNSRTPRSKSVTFGASISF